MNTQGKVSDMENRATGARRAGYSAMRFSWRMRSVALVVMLTTGGLPLSLTAARAEHLHRQIEANKPHVRVVNELKPGLTDKLTPAQWKQVEAQRAKEAADKEAKKPDVRVLTLKEMQNLHGSGPYRNKYCAGTLPWHRSLRDVNLCNGNLFKSFTDIQVAPAKGAGLALQRTYNSQDERPGPFGVGWTHAYDIRMEDENPTTGQTDDSLNIADRTDFFGARHKYHRDADGLYSPPPYLFDETSSDYQAFLVNGPIVALDDTEVGMDGTTKHFVKVADNWRACDSIKDRYGNTTTLTYGVGSASSLLAAVTDPSGRTLTFTWTNLGTSQQPIYRISQVDGPQYSVAYAYNADANLSSVTLDPGVGHLNRTTTFGYTSVTGANGTETGLLSSITDSLNHTVSYTYSLTMNVLGSTLSTPTGMAWPSSVTEPAGVDTNNTPRTLTWSINGHEADNSAGQVVQVATDAYLRKTGLVLAPSAYGAITSLYATTYDSANNVLSTRDKSGINASAGTEGAVRGDVFTYGPHGNVLTHQVSGSAGMETTSYYNGSQYFQKQSVTDMNGHTTSFGVGGKTDTIGNRGSVLWVKDARYGNGSQSGNGVQFSYAYNTLGQKVSETNQNGVVTNYTYGGNGDTWGNLTQVVQDPNPQGQTGHLARTTSMTYDVAGHVLTSTDPKGQQSSFSYNVLGQPTSAAFPATMNGATQVTPAETVSYSYGGNGRTESVTDNRGTTSLSYESGCDRVHSVTDPVTGQISYVYGLTGERASMSLPGGGTWTYQFASTWDYNGWLLPKDDPNSVAWQINSLTDDQGRRIDINSLATSGLGCDEVGNLKGLRTNQAFTSGSSPQAVSYQEADYTYDGDQGLAGQFTSHRWLTRMKQTFHGVSANTTTLLVQNDYTYDAAGQRTSNLLSSIDPTTGNLTSRTETYGYDELNRLTSVDYGDGETQSYTFDSMGNRTGKSDTISGTTTSESYVVNAANMLTSRTVGSTTNAYTNDSNGNTLTGGGRTNTWDSENRMTKCVNGANTSTFTYGSDGLRHRSVVNGTTTDFVLDNSMFIRELSSTGGVKATYFMGASGPAYRRDDANGGTVRWYLYDGHGSVLGEVNPNGAITATRKYDAYGTVRSSTGTSTSSHKFVGLLGHPSEDETGLIYMRARYMDPTVGRFVSEDKSAQGANWFVYCGDDPVNRLDPSGKITVAEIIAFWQGIQALLNDPKGWADLTAEQLKDMIAEGVAKGVPGAGRLAKILRVNVGDDVSTLLRSSSESGGQLLRATIEPAADADIQATLLRAEVQEQVNAEQISEYGRWGSKTTVDGIEAEQSLDAGTGGE